MSEVTVVIGAGSIGHAISRRISAGKHVVLADLRQENADAVAQVMLDAGFDVRTTTVDVSHRDSVHALVEAATALGDMTGVIHAAGVSPSQASPATILAVDLYGTALVLEEFGNVIARGGAGVVIASQSGHRLGALTHEENAALATTPTEELLGLPMLQLDRVSDPLHAYQLAKRGARVNTISPGIIITPLARDELTGPRGEGYRRMLELSPAGRAGTPDEVATVAALLMGSDGAFITGSDFLVDGGVTASYFYGELAPQVTAHSGRLPVHDTNSHGLEAALMASNAERTTTATIITVNDRPPASSPNTNGSADPADGVVQRSSQHEIVHLDRRRDMPPSRPSPRT